MGLGRRRERGCWSSYDGLGSRWRLGGLIAVRSRTENILVYFYHVWQWDTPYVAAIFCCVAPLHFVVPNTSCSMNYTCARVGFAV
jgi:hypothetical protein